MNNSAKIGKFLLMASTGAALLPVVGCGNTKEEGKKPLNIIYIMSDDHTSQAIGVYNSRLAPLNPTPVIDQLASEGVVFDNCFCANSISTPSRATMITGQYSHHNTVLTLDEKLRDDQQYLPREMKKLGYETAIVGKWHLGTEPTAFDYYNVFTQHGEQGSYFDPHLATSDSTSLPFPKNIKKFKGYCSDIVTDITLNWLETKRDKNKPFFLMHHYKAPHDNFEFAPRYADYLADIDIPEPETLFNRDGFGSVATRGENDSLNDYIGTSVSSRNKFRNYVDMYKVNTGDPIQDTKEAYNEYLKSYLRCVKGVDDNLARLFDYLKKNDLWDNTVIIYTGDQGMMLGEHDLQDKRWGYDESMRMPFIMRVPESKLTGAIHENMMIGNIDFAPTILSLAGLKETPEYMDGKDFSSLFATGQEPEGWRKASYFRYWMHMIHHNVPAHFLIRTDDYKLIFFYGEHYDTSRNGEKAMAWLKEGESAPIGTTPAGFELYDLKKDPYETTNVVNDPAYAEVFESLKKQLLELKKEAGDDDTAYPQIQKVIDANF